MNKKLPITLAAALAAAVLGVTGTQPSRAAEDAPAAAGQDDPRKAAQDSKQPVADEQAPAPPSFPAGVKVDDEQSGKRGEVFKTLNSITEAAFTKDGFDDVVERLVDQDRNRIGQDNFAEQKFDDLNAKVDALRTAWKDKYGEDFELKGDLAFAKALTTVGTIDDPKAVASAWPVPAVTQAAGEAVPDSAKETAGNADPNLNSNVEKGRGVAIATIPASHGLPGLNVSLINELQGWRIDVPNTLTGQQLHDSLLRHLTHVLEMRDQWPADKNEAALRVAHHVLLSAYGVDVKPTEPGDAPPDRP